MKREARSVKESIKTLLVAIHAPYNVTKNIGSYYEEFLNLVKTAGIEYTDVIYIKLRDIDRANFISRGHLDHLHEICKRDNIEQVIISEPLLPRQERNLSDYLECAVIDRTELILNIFENAAQSGEGKLQVEIARLQHKKSRLSGKGQFLEQQKGVAGVRGGAGETLKEQESRYIENRILTFTKQLERLQQTRETQRKQRLTRQIPLICIIGYTNAGKSSLLNALTKSNVVAENKLFATLDTTTRELYVDSQKKGLISDTVGFIQLLPPTLIEAFKSTLDELQYADLLLQVVDVSDPNWQEHIKVVQSILRDLGVEKEMLYVFNKTDKIEVTPALLEQVNQFQPYVFTSTLNKDGLQTVITFLKNWQPKKQISF